MVAATDIPTAIQTDTLTDTVPQTGEAEEEEVVEIECPILELDSKPSILVCKLINSRSFRY